MAATEHIGAPTPPKVVTIERGPVSRFAAACKDEDPVYADADAAHAAGFPGIPAPPTFSFAMAHWGTFREQQPDGADAEHPMLAIIGDLMRERPGLILHGEQEFTYHRPIVVGDVLTSSGRVLDVRTKTREGGPTMTFVDTETRWRDAEGNPVVTEVMTLIHRA